MNKELISIIGAGGHARSLINIIDKKQFVIEGIYDDSYENRVLEFIHDVEVKGTLFEVPKKLKVIIATGDINKRSIQLDMFKNQLLDSNFFHRTSTIENNVVLGNRNHFFANTLLNSYVKIGDNNIVNSGAIIEHETVIGNDNHISVGVVLCGRVIIGSNCFVGAGSVIIDKIKICDGVTIGANSLVINDILEPGTYVGNPLRKIK